MGTRAQNQSDENPELPPDAAAEPQDDQPTAELEDVVVVEDVESESRSGDRAEAPTTPMEAEDVFVILPEGEAGNVPMVDTQVVEEEAVASPAGANDPTSSSLQQIQEELDDEILTEMGPAAGEEIPTELAGDDQEAELELQEPAIEIEPAPAGGRGLWLKVGLPAAAALLLGIGGALYYFPGAGEAETHGGVAVTPPAGTPVTTAPVDSGPIDVVTTTTPPADLLAEAREAFRTKLQLAIRLGLGGEGHR